MPSQKTNSKTQNANKIVIPHGASPKVVAAYKKAFEAEQRAIASKERAIKEREEREERKEKEQKEEMKNNPWFDNKSPFKSKKEHNSQNQSDEKVTEKVIEKREFPKFKIIKYTGGLVPKVLWRQRLELKSKYDDKIDTYIICHHGNQWGEEVPIRDYNLKFDEPYILMKFPVDSEPSPFCANILDFIHKYCPIKRIEKRNTDFYVCYPNMVEGMELSYFCGILKLISKYRHMSGRPLIMLEKFVTNNKSKQQNEEKTDDTEQKEEGINKSQKKNSFSVLRVESGKSNEVC